MIFSKSYSIGEALELGLIIIAKTVAIAPSVRIVSEEDDGKSHGVITIGENTIIRENVVICSGVKIGSNTMIGHMVVLRKCVEIGNGCVISHLTNIERDTKIGNHVRISALTHLTGGCIIEDGVEIGARVVTINDNQLAWGTNPILVAPIFREGSRVGSGVALLSGVEVGANALIGAGAVVTRSIPENVIAFGVPAYVQRDRLTAETSST
jgi:acetyltransferase-like isoleucine patch superfamily enzyme